MAPKESCQKIVPIYMEKKLFFPVKYVCVCVQCQGVELLGKQRFLANWEKYLYMITVQY